MSTKLRAPENFDVTVLLQALSVAEPCGANLEYHPVFLQLESELKGRPEVEYGEVVTEAILPDWKLVEKLALDLLQQSRDLRVVMALIRAFISRYGFEGFAAGLELLSGLLEQHWSSVHPQLDPSDGNDPMLRVNTLSGLLERTGVLFQVREVALVSSRVHGVFCWRDIEVMLGEVSIPESEEKPSQQGLDAAFKEMGQDAIQMLHDALVSICNSIVNIDKVLTQQIGAGQSIDFSLLIKLSVRIKDFIESKIIKTRAVLAGNAAAESGEVVDGKQSLEMSVDHIVITSRADLVKMIEKMCMYLADYEPSSPVPLLLRRAQSWIDRSFIEILEDMAPDSLEKVEFIAGIKRE